MTNSIISKDCLDAVAASIGYNSPVVLTFVLVSFLVLLANTFTGGLANTLFFSTYRSSPFNPLTYIRMVGHVLGHSGFDHYMGNMMTLLLIGPILEEKYGSTLLLMMILATAVITSIVHCFFSSGTALCGASGIVFMLMLLASVVQVQEGKIPLTLILVAVLYVGHELWAWLTVDDNVSRLTHIIGGACGAWFGMMLARVLLG